MGISVDGAGRLRTLETASLLLADAGTPPGAALPRASSAPSSVEDALETKRHYYTSATYTEMIEAYLGQPDENSHCIFEKLLSVLVLPALQ